MDAEYGSDIAEYGDTFDCLHEEDVQGMLTQWAPHLMDREKLEGEDLLAAALDWTSTDEALKLLGKGQDDGILEDLSFGMQEAMPENIWFPSGK